MTIFTFWTTFKFEIIFWLYYSWLSSDTPTPLYCLKIRVGRPDNSLYVYSSFVILIMVFFVTESPRWASKQYRGVGVPSEYVKLENVIFSQKRVIFSKFSMKKRNKWKCRFYDLGAQRRQEISGLEKHRFQVEMLMFFEKRPKKRSKCTIGDHLHSLFRVVRRVNQPLIRGGYPHFLDPPLKCLKNVTQIWNLF